jgi:hypothetical protein
VALRYSEDGAPSSAAAFTGDIGLVASLWNILVARRLQIELAFLEPVPTAGSRDRHHVAEAAAERMAAWLDVPPPLGRRFNAAANRGGDKAGSEPDAGGGTARPAP